MDNQAEEEPTGPSVDAEDPEERILARRLRIQKRQEAQKKYFTILVCLFGLLVEAGIALRAVKPT